MSVRGMKLGTPMGGAEASATASQVAGLWKEHGEEPEGGELDHCSSRHYSGSVLQVFVCVCAGGVRMSSEADLKLMKRLQAVAPVMTTSAIMNSWPRRTAS